MHEGTTLDTGSSNCGDPRPAPLVQARLPLQDAYGRIRRSRSASGTGTISANSMNYGDPRAMTRDSWHSTMKSTECQGDARLDPSGESGFRCRVFLDKSLK